MIQLELLPVVAFFPPLFSSSVSKTAEQLTPRAVVWLLSSYTDDFALLSVELEICEPASGYK